MHRAERADAIIRQHVTWAAGAGALPVPGADVLSVTAIQVTLAARLAEVYQLPFTEKLGRQLVVSLTGASLARLLSSMAKGMPGIGSLIAIPTQALLSGASTYAVGQVFKTQYAAGSTLESLRTDELRAAYRHYLRLGRSFVRDLRGDRIHRDRFRREGTRPQRTGSRSRWRRSRRAHRDTFGPWREDPVPEVVATLQRLAQLREAGNLTAAEYEQLKRDLLERAGRAQDREDAL